LWLESGGRNPRQRSSSNIVDLVSPDGKTLVFRTNRRLALWDLASRDGKDQPAIVPNFEGETIAFNPDGATLATYQDAKAGSAITLWDVAALMASRHDRE
jgi:WD40 repeat protein